MTEAPTLAPRPTPDGRARRRRAAALVVAGLTLTLAAACVVFLTIGARGPWAFVLSFRGQRLAALLVVAAAGAMATIAFQAITRNRILTPSIVGFDALFALMQTALVFFVGAAAVSRMDGRLLFLFELAAMLGFAWMIRRGLFDAASRGLTTLLLVGVVFGLLFRSVAGLMQRLMDPGEFVVLQDRLFASFNLVAPELLGLAAALTIAGGAALWRMGPALDVLALGREQATALGLEWRSLVGAAFLLAVALTALSTALVGPVTFFGLLAANAAYALAPIQTVRWTAPMAALAGAIMLVGGQTLLERALGWNGALGMVVELVGGAALLVLLLTRGPR
jgi:iron complex transport system permease protein